jgi:hypothetical protein
MSATKALWWKFSEAEASMLDALKIYDQNPAPQKPHRAVFDAASKLLPIAQRFYLPSSRDILEGKLIDQQIKDLVRLPYEVTALISECDYFDPGEKPQELWKITVAFDPFGPVNEKIQIIRPEFFKPRSFAILSLMPTITKWPAWSTLPVMCALQFDDDQTGWKLEAMILSKEFYEEQRELRARNGLRQLVEEYIDDVASITNLCAILNLSNTSTVALPPPKGAQRSRQRKGKLPLYDYHILEVDGERWDSPYTSSGAGQGYRSHLRRGHIRRLSDDRYTWVRATYGHGSVDGFVDKDYAVKPKEVA